MRRFSTFSYRDASYRISPGRTESGKDNFGGGRLYELITIEIKKIREALESYIQMQPEFLKSLEPVKLQDGAPEAAVLMAEAADLTGTGPMAAVAGTTAQLAAARAAVGIQGPIPRPEIIIENGGDIFILPKQDSAGSEGAAEPVTAGIFSGLHSRFSRLALLINPPPEGIAVCSSSSRMGHSLSLGDCDLCTVVSSNAALADAAATLGCNLVKTEADLGPAAERIAAIKGVNGVLLIKNQQLAMAGKLPRIIKHSDPAEMDKITGTFLR